MSKRVRWDQRVGSKVANFLKKSEHYITSRNGWVSLKGIFRWYICRRDPSTYLLGIQTFRWDQLLLFKEKSECT